MHAVLFHVEHSGDARWSFRWRMAEPATGVYRVWQEQTIAAPFGFIQSPLVGAVIEVEVRPGEGDWVSPVSLQLSKGHAVFRVEAREDFESPPEGFLVCAPGLHSGVSAFVFPYLKLAAGESREVTATADAPVPANLLLAPGEFRPQSGPLCITNLSAASAAWCMISASTPPFQLTACPESAGRRLYAYAPEKVAQHLVQSVLPETPPTDPA